MLIILPLIWLHFQIRAQNPGDRKGLYGSLCLGTGLVNTNATSAKMQASLRLSMHISLGYFIDRSVQVGVTGNGWLFESYRWNRAEVTGESISNDMIYAQWYPFLRNRIFIKGAYGLSHYTNLRPDKDYGKGRVGMLATGFEKHIGKKEVLWGMQISLNYGNLNFSGPNTPIDRMNRKFNTADVTLFIGLD